MGKRREQRTRIAIPVKVHTRDGENRPVSAMACTMDLTPSGARLSGVTVPVVPGDVLCVERGMNRNYFQVMWVGSKEQGTFGQVGLLCIDPETNIWGVELLPGLDER